MVAAVVSLAASLTVAVGLSGAASATPMPARTLVRLGTAVRVLPEAAGHVVLSAISCPTTRSCLAVGTGAAGRAVVARGSEVLGRWVWSPAWVLAHGPSGSDRLSAVSCPTPTSCVAVGTDGAGRSEAASGARTRAAWHWRTPVAVAPDGAGGDSLAAVSCPAARTCVAVGKDAAAQGIVTVATRTGSVWTWAAALAVAPDVTGSGRLTSVSCAAKGTCVAVGVDAASKGIFSVGARRGSSWKWSTETLVGVTTETLVGVSCASATRCVGVGNDTSGHATSSLGSARGATWTWRPPKFLGVLETVRGLACTTTRLCVAVGSTPSVETNQYELGHLASSGVAWSGAKTVPAVGPRVEGFAAVACAAADSCTAVGHALGGGAVAVSSKAAPAEVLRARVRRGNASATVRWGPPEFDGGERIASYRVVASPGGASCAVAARGLRVERCTVAHLVNGTRYRFTITADNGIGVSTPSVPSAPVIPSPFQPAIASPFSRSVLQYLSSQRDVVSATVCDLLTGQTWRVHPTSVQHTASIVKVEILAALLYQEQVRHVTLPASIRALATSMIEFSDNSAASALYGQVGQEPGLAAFSRLIGMTGTTANWAWGFTDTTSLDQTRVLRLFVAPNDVLDAASRAFGLGLMEHVTPAQAWGVSAGPGSRARVALKNGWFPTATLNWQVNSIGWIDGGGRSYLLAVLTDHDATMGDGVTTIETLSTMVWQALGRKVPLR